MPTLSDRYRGGLVGLAAGDALGTTLEFKRPAPSNIADMVGGVHSIPIRGQWTDDISMARSRPKA